MLSSHALQKTVSYAVAAYVLSYPLGFLVAHIRKMLLEKKMKARALKKRKDRDDKRKAFRLDETMDPNLVMEICNLKAHELATRIKEGKLTSEQVVRAFCIRARACGLKYDCNAEEFFAEAIEEAKEADRKLQELGADNVGWLHGVPISLKDQVDQKGADSTCGMAVRCFRPAAEDGIPLQLLRRQGAIPFVRSNVPQSLMLPESGNAIWGTAKNPWNLDRTPGGSSGGEAVLVAARASPLGVGTDIGGSVRIPAHYCGIYAYKPTPSRITKFGVSGNRRPGMEGSLELIKSCIGPMANCVEDLVLVMRSWLEPAAFDMDPLQPPIPFNQEIFSSSKSLVFGYYLDDGFFEPSLPCKRAVETVVDALRKAGHRVIPFQPHNIPRAIELYYAAMSSDGGMRNFVEGLQGEALHESYRLLYFMANLPTWARSTMTKLLSMANNPRAAALNKAGGAKTAYELQEITAELLAYIDKFTKDVMEAGIDIIICPGLSLPALQHGWSKDLNPSVSYTMLFNLLRYPAGTVPVTRVRPDECHYETSRPEHQDILTKRAKAAMVGASGLPVGVQVAALPWQDEKCLRGMKIIQDLISFDEKPPGCETL
eukprot:TRINITY_DN622_c0_g1_i1.p1 TRINITY_DN622_c0_g1~~TRINITY_DN622_c0_g1_i1.p1  ORF type:complete len:599 (-),score=128.60 TRINITY_DN622_c0_g1_i1:144-1940(-)